MFRVVSVGARPPSPSLTHGQCQEDTFNKVIIKVEKSTLNGVLCDENVPTFFCQVLNPSVVQMFRLVLKLVVFVKMYKIPLNFKLHPPGHIMNYWIFKSLFTVNVCLAMEYCI